MRKTLISVLAILAVIYAAVCGLMYTQQRSMMYFPSKSILPDPKLSGLQITQTTTADGLHLQAWFMPPAKPGNKIIVFFHGNANNLLHMWPKAESFVSAGYGAFLCEYRGYGGNPGMPTEQGFYQDGRAAFAWLKDHGYKNDQLVIYGESIGTGVSVQMATEVHPREMILEAAFSSTADVAKDRYGIIPVDYLMLDKYESANKIVSLHDMQLLQIHGDHDRTIPIQFGKKLFAAANEPKTFMLVPGADHNNLYAFGIAPRVVKWLDDAVKAEKTEQSK